MFMSNDIRKFRAHYGLTTRRRKKRRDVQAWRKPSGIDRSIAGKRGPRPKIGYGHKNTEKNTHPSNLKEYLIFSKTDLESLPEDEKIAIRFSSKVGKKKRLEILEIIKDKNYKVLN